MRFWLRLCSRTQLHSFRALSRSNNRGKLAEVNATLRGLFLRRTTGGVGERFGDSTIALKGLVTRSEVPLLSRFAICKGLKEGKVYGCGGGSLVLQSVELNIKSIEQSLYY